MGYKLNLFDSHLHTTYSHDSRATPGGLIRAGMEAGLSGVVFTDHYDTGFLGINSDNIVPAKYAKNSELLGLRSVSGFSVLRGIELSPMAHAIDRVKREMNGADFDFVILSAHFLNDTPQSDFQKLFLTQKKKDLYDAYIFSLVDMVSAYKDFDALGHFDYIARYADYADPVMRYREQADAFDELFKTLIKMGKTLEINTSSYIRYGIKYDFDRDILLRYRELGGSLVSLGSDSHREKDVGTGFLEFSEIIKSCGFTSAVHYVERRPIQDKL